MGAVVGEATLSGCRGILEPSRKSGGIFLQFDRTWSKEERRRRQANARPSPHLVMYCRMTSPRRSNRECVELRSKCFVRRRTASHDCVHWAGKIPTESKLGLVVESSQVRLIPHNNDPYMWKTHNHLHKSHATPLWTPIVRRGTTINNTRTR